MGLAEFVDNKIGGQHEDSKPGDEEAGARSVPAEVPAGDEGDAVDENFVRELYEPEEEERYRARVVGQNERSIIPDARRGLRREGLQVGEDGCRKEIGEAELE